MLDVDHFKEVNDEHGHQTGDRILYEISKAIDMNCRNIDKIGRYGGEEFLIVCPETNEQSAYALAERIRKSVMNITDTEVKNVSCSIGIATNTKQENVNQLIQQADKALYIAKDLGRNKTIIYEAQAVT